MEKRHPVMKIKNERCHKGKIDLIGELTCQVAAGDEDEAEGQFSVIEQSHVSSLAAKTDTF